jgi:hypothetical protein
LDKDTSGEVYRSRELAEKLNLTLRSVACISNNVVEKYRTGVFSSSVGKEVLWWGNPVAIQQLKEALNKYGQS